ncbi:unnamed protein product [Withania somnifera]
MLLKIQGVESVKIDEKLGNLVISGTVDPATILTMLEKLGRKAELLWEQGHPIVHTNFQKGPHPNGEGSRITDSRNVQIIRQSKVINPLNDPDIMTQLEQLSGIPGLKTIEATKTIKLSFQGESRNELPGDKILEISTTKNVNGGGFCGASSSCCGGHGAINHSHNHHGCCHGGNTSYSSCCGNRRSCCDGHCQPHSAMPPPPPPPPPPWATTDTIPSAPPLPSEYFQASLSSMPRTYYNVLSDENVNGCIII